MRVGLAALLVCGCDGVFGLEHIPVPEATCADDSECVRGGAQGQCSCGFCSYTDSACPGSMLRWADGALAPIENACVPAIEQIDARVFHTCARMTDGTAWCWGWNLAGQLGGARPPGEDSLVPIPVLVDGMPLGGVAEIRTGAETTCVRIADGTARCWGGNTVGQLGAGLPTGTGQRALAPVTVASPAGPLADVTALAVGYHHGCALTEPAGGPDTIYCWGSNSGGQVGRPAGEPHASLATAVAGLPAGEVVALAAGGEHTCASVVRPSASSTYCWGNERDGALGNGMYTTANTHQPVPQLVRRTASLAELRGVTRIGAGNRHVCAIAANQATERVCWGLNAYGALGDGIGTARAYAEPVAGAPNATHTLIAASDEHSCGMQNATLQCWGSDADGQIGDGPGDRDPHFVPFDVIPATPMVDLTAGFRFTCVLDTQRRLRCWGANRNGALGDETGSAHDAPHFVSRSLFCPG